MDDTNPVKKKASDAAKKVGKPMTTRKKKPGRRRASKKTETVSVDHSDGDEELDIPKNGKVFEMTPTQNDEPRDLTSEDGALRKAKPFLVQTEQIAAKLNKFYLETAAYSKESFQKDYFEFCNLPLGGHTFLETALGKTVPLLNSTRVEVESSRYHASRVEIEGMKFIMGQAPDEDKELFWRMVFSLTPSAVVLLCPFFEAGAKQMDEFFPQEKDTFRYYGQMYVNNKKVEHIPFASIYTLEVLPGGCSNSFVTRLIHCTQWPRDSTPKQVREFLVMVRCAKEDSSPQTPIMVLSKSGTGRAGCLVGHMVLSQYLLSNSTTGISSVKRMLIQLREQRAEAIDNLLQYAFIWVSTIIYLRTKTRVKLYIKRWSALLRHIGQCIKE